MDFAKVNIFADRRSLWNRLTILGICALISGCDSRGNQVTRGVEGTAKKLEGQVDFKYVGQGKTKRKETLSREERLRKLRQLGREQGSEG